MGTFIYRRVFCQGHISNMFLQDPSGKPASAGFSAQQLCVIFFFFHVLQPLTVKLREKVSLEWESKERGKKPPHLNIISSFIFQQCSCHFFSLTSALWWFQTASLMTPLVRLHQCLYFKDWSSLPVIPLCRCLYDNTKLSSWIEWHFNFHSALSEYSMSAESWSGCWSIPINGFQAEI